MDQFRKMIINDVAHAMNALGAAMNELQNEREPNYTFISRALSISSHHTLIGSELSNTHTPYAIQWAMMQKQDR
jgi:hypothetical protein